MRPIYFFILMFFAAPAVLPAQDPVAAVMRNTVWPDAGVAKKSFDWSLFTLQYYCVSNWNATGISAGYTSGSGHSSFVFLRDGIPGYSWYHLYLSHFRQFRKVSCMLQLRASMIGLKERPPTLRLGGNIDLSWKVSEMLSLQVDIFDFPGWIFPSNVTRGDPEMAFFLFHEPGRLIGLIEGFRISQLQFGPITSGIRINLNDKISLIGLFDVLPFGVSLGINWTLNRYNLHVRLEQHNGLGITPEVQIGF